MGLSSFPLGLFGELCEVVMIEDREVYTSHNCSCATPSITTIYFVPRGLEIRGSININCVGFICSRRKHSTLIMWFRHVISSSTSEFNRKIIYVQNIRKVTTHPPCNTYVLHRRYILEIHFTPVLRGLSLTSVI